MNERIAWAIGQVAPRPSHHVLEVGCGHGVAVSLLCERLATGSITAVDRSAKMIEATRRRVASACGGIPVELVQAELADVELEDGAFDRIFAINVNVLWREGAERELERMRGWLAPKGRLYLFAQAPPQMARPEPGFVPRMLEASGYSAVAVMREDLATSRVLAVVAAG